MSKLKFLLSIAFVCILFVLCTVASSAESGGGGVAPASIPTVNFSNAITFDLNLVYEIELDESCTELCYKFIPTTTGFYVATSYNRYSGDPILYFYNSSGTLIEWADDYIITADPDNFESSIDFQLVYHLSANVTYYFVVGNLSGSSAYYEFDIDLLSSSGWDVGTSLNLGANATVEIDIPYEVKVFKVDPTPSGNHMFFSSNSSGDPKFLVYNHQFQYVGGGDDDGEGNNFSSIVSLPSMNIHYIVAIQYGSRTGSYTLNTLDRSALYNQSYYLKNIGTSMHLAVEIPEEGEEINAEQDEFKSEDQAKWFIQYESDGWYTIRSQYGSQKYLGVLTSNINSDIELYDSIADKTKWGIFEDSNDNIYFVPKTATDRMLYFSNSSVGTDVSLVPVLSSSNNAKWTSAHVDALNPYRVPSNMFALEIDNNDNGNTNWSSLIQAAMTAWNDSDACTYVQITPNISSYKIIIGNFGGDNPAFVNSSWEVDRYIPRKMYIDLDAMPTDDDMRITIIMHEIGHFLGLADNPPYPEFYTIMIASWRVFEAPMEYDINNVLFVYD